MKAVVTVPCGTCGGSGCVPLSPAYWRTFAVLRAVKRTTAAKLCKQFGIKATAMNNRLAALEKHGLATSEVVGRERWFKPAKGGA